MEPTEENLETSKDFNFAERRGRVFATTRWTEVVAAGQGEGASSEVALERLCQKYWPPIYAFVRRRVSNAHDAEDLTQAFFAFLLEKEGIKKADRQKGKFRTFLLAALTNFLNNEWDRSRTWKRGGRCQVVALEEMAEEEQWFRERADGLTPERLFDRRWVQQLIEQALRQLRKEHQSPAKAKWLSVLEPGLTGEMERGLCGEWGAKLGMSEEAVRTALSRLRLRYKELLRKEIAQTVASPAEVDEEIRQLFAALSN